MLIRTHLRRLLHVTLAVTMAAGLLHGASMDFANAAPRTHHVAPHDMHSRHMAAHNTSEANTSARDTGENEMGAHTPHEPAPSNDKRHSTSAMPGCPLANVVAIQPATLIEIQNVASARIALHTLPPLLSTDPSLMDPPPRAAS